MTAGARFKPTLNIHLNNALSRSRTADKFFIDGLFNKTKLFESTLQK